MIVMSFPSPSFFSVSTNLGLVLSNSADVMSYFTVLLRRRFHMSDGRQDNEVILQKTASSSSFL